MKKIFTIVLAVVLSLIAMTISVSADVVNAKMLKTEDGNEYWHTLDGEKIEGLFEFEYDNGQKCLMIFGEDGKYQSYTGLAKARKSGKTYYYYYGIKSTGWRKIKKSWYHFDENGVMDTGRVKIADGTYIFDENGKWTGKLTKSSKCPDDFSFYFNGAVEIDTAENYINKPFVSENGKTDFVISKRDLQVIYSALQEYDIDGLCALEYDITPQNLIYPENYDLIWQDPNSYYITKYVANGKDYRLKGDNDALFITENRLGNAYAQNYYEFVEFITRYLEQTKEYKSLPENDICLE